MTIEQFNEFMNKEIEVEKSIMASKGEEYIMSGDERLDNFRKVAKLLDRPNSADVIATYLLKHIFSILNYINKGKEVSDEPISERIRDARNYLMFLHAEIAEKKLLVEGYKTLEIDNCHWR